MLVTGLYRLDVITNNGFIYPKNEFIKALDKYLADENNSHIGEFIKDSKYDRIDYTEIDPFKISHIVKEYREVSDGIEIVCDIDNNDLGKYIIENLNSVKYGPRITCRINKDNTVNDIEIIAIDILDILDESNDNIALKYYKEN